MFRNTIVASAIALAGTALAQTAGQAVVVNSCNYPVYLQNTPSAGGGYSTISQTLESGDSYSQQWTSLSNGNGWSLKLSENGETWDTDILQYEYTWHGWSGEWGGIIWYDVSLVNGQTWNSTWFISADGSCTPRQTYYAYPTDDEAGEQSCPGASTITVNLCSGSAPSGNTGGSGSSSSSPDTTPSQEPTSTQAPATSTQAPATSVDSPQPTQSQGQPWAPQWNGDGNSFGEAKVKENKKNKASPTTLATVASNRGGVTVTEVATQVVTNFVTATAEAVNKRHEHVARHAHHHF